MLRFPHQQLLLHVNSPSLSVSKPRPHICIPRNRKPFTVNLNTESVSIFDFLLPNIYVITASDLLLLEATTVVLLLSEIRRSELQ